MNRKFLTVCLLLVSAAHSRAAGLNDLDEVTTWKDVANGVWSAQLGDTSQITRYTDFAAALPKLAELNALYPAEPFPFQQRQIRFRVARDHKLAIHIPVDLDEQIFGYGLQFDSTQKNGKILDLKVDHFSKGGGATHAPVPFFISSKGYGVFFNTAQFLKVYNNVGNRKDSTHNPPPVDRNPPPDEKQPGPWRPQPVSDAVEAYLHADGVELIVFQGRTLQDVVARYNLFCGGGAMPPLWGLGFWQRVPSTFNAEQTLAEIADFEKQNIPLDVIGLEPGWQTKSYPCTYEWQKKRFPDAEGLCQSLLSKGIPPVRSLLLEATATNGELVEDTSLYMFGPSILVAPFFEKRATQRSVDLPAGNWYDFYTGEFVGNGATVHVTAEQFRGLPPLFVKEGAVIPLLSKAVPNTEAAYGHPLEVRHYGHEAGRFMLYEDDGKTYDYQQGDFRLRQIDVRGDGVLTESIIVSRGPAMFGNIEKVRQMTQD